MSISMDILTPPQDGKKHPRSPMGQPRERTVPCKGGCNTRTWNHCGWCDKHCPHDVAPTT
jgi:hypothetical protein